MVNLFFWFNMTLFLIIFSFQSFLCMLMILSLLILLLMFVRGFFLPRIPGHDIRSSFFRLVKLVFFPVNSIIITTVTISVLLLL